jgi:hypothetical protein
VTYDILKPGSIIQNSSSTLLTPYHLINDATTYFDSFDVFKPVHDTGCSLIFTTIQQPYKENCFISFKDYVKDNNAFSLLEEKKIVMNYGDVLLGIDGVDIEGKYMQSMQNQHHCSTNIPRQTLVSQPDQEKC